MQTDPVISNMRKFKEKKLHNCSMEAIQLIRFESNLDGEE